jgi:hypothetical protein
MKSARTGRKHGCSDAFNQVLPIAAGAIAIVIAVIPCVIARNMIMRHPASAR